jgi:hypothetical protein
MLENEESQAADAIVCHMPKSPAPSNMSTSKLPQLNLDTNSMSGLSILVNCIYINKVYSFILKYVLLIVSPAVIISQFS